MPEHLISLKVPIKKTESGDTPKRNDVQAAARKALSELLEPLAGFVLDAGVSAQELHSIFRSAAVRSAATRQLEVARRINISGIAASTGIPRADIARILSSTTAKSRIKVDRQQQATNRILSAWYADPKFTTPNGQPSDLRLYGRGATFEALAKRHGRGIPPRALLDELTRTGAVELLSSQRVRAKTPVAVNRGVSPRVIKAFGDRATELLSTMLQNMRNPGRTQFIANIGGATVSPDVLPLIRREISTKGSDFLAGIQDVLFQGQLGESGGAGSAAHRVSVTIFYNESHPRKDSNAQSRIARRNFRRVPR